MLRLKDPAEAERVRREVWSRLWPQLRDLLDAQARKLALRDPLGVGVILNFLRLKEAETARLRLVARGKFYGVPRERLAEELGSA